MKHGMQALPILVETRCQPARSHLCTMISTSRHLLRWMTLHFLSLAVIPARVQSQSKIKHAKSRHNCVTDATLASNFMQARRAQQDTRQKAKKKVILTDDTPVAGCPSMDLPPRRPLTAPPPRAKSQSLKTGRHMDEFLRAFSVASNQPRRRKSQGWLGSG